MTESPSPDADPDRSRRRIALQASRWSILLVVGVGVGAAMAVEPVAAQSSAAAFCETDMAATIKNIFTLIQFGGPLIGGVIALGSTVVLPTVRRSDNKRTLKEARNQALLWGVLVAPLGTTILGFLLNNVVAGGTSCGF